MKLYSHSSFANTASDFIMVVANICKVNLEEEVVKAGSDKAKQLKEYTLPVLEIDGGVLIQDSTVIAAYIA